MVRFSHAVQNYSHLLLERNVYLIDRNLIQTIRSPLISIYIIQYDHILFHIETNPIFLWSMK